jgi:hypothetical protein
MTRQIDKCLARSEREFEANTIPWADLNPALGEKPERARAKLREQSHESISKPLAVGWP